MAALERWLPERSKVHQTRSPPGRAAAIEAFKKISPLFRIEEKTSSGFIVVGGGGGGALNTLAQSSGLYGRRTVNLASNNVYHGINDKCSCLRASVHQRVRCILKSSGVAT